MKAELKKYILRALHQADGLPFPEGSLVQAVKLLARPEQPTGGDVAAALQECDAEGFIIGVTDDFDHQRTWMLSDKGRHKARQISQ